jgi:peptidoglycan hydrolase-like protein with peptidoglycan-binding domain
VKQLLRERKGSLAASTGLALLLTIPSFSPGQIPVPSPSQGQIPAPSSDVSLTVGSSGEAVVFLQQTLMPLGYYAGALDGYFGSYTEAAVKAFQKANGLYVDGVVGPYTWAALRGGNASTEPAGKAAEPQTGKSSGDLVYGMTSDEIAYIQTILDILGYHVGVIDGYFGDVTLEAVKAFQRDYGLYVDGVIGAQTKAALGIQ